MRFPKRHKKRASFPYAMNWTKLLYILIIILLYVPMVFLGANVFFPEYTGMDSYFQQFPDCYSRYPYPEKLTPTETEAISEQQQACQEAYNMAQREWEQGKLAYQGRKYVYTALFNLVVLLAALFIPLQNSILMGLFLGSIATTFGATVYYFATRSKIGFAILVITFIAMLYFINKEKDSFIDWKERKK